MTADFAFRNRYTDHRRGGYKCPACLQRWFGWDGFARHMRQLHHRCRFCTKAYIRVERHEKLAHTNEYAVEAGACRAAARKPE